MYPQNPYLLERAAKDRTRDLLATAERVSPVPAGIGSGYPPAVLKSLGRLLVRIGPGQRNARPLAAGEPRPQTTGLAG